LHILTEKYQPAEILQIIRANYIQQQQFDDIVLKGQELTFELKRRLENRGIDVSDFRPSTQLESLVKKYKSVLIEEINQLAPTVLPPIDYKTNWIYKWGLRLLMTFPITLILFWKESNWAWATAGICFIGCIMTRIGAKLDPKQASFDDIFTVADLVRKISFKSIS
jgi:hypothetical protein